MFAVELGDRIKFRRYQSGLTQNQMAESLFVSPQAVSKWERGENSPDITLLPGIAKLLGVTVDWLLSGNRLEQFIKESYFFSNFTDNEIYLLLPYFEKMEFKPGDYLFKEGAPDKAGLYIVEQGFVKIIKGKDVVREVRAGGIFCDYSTLDCKLCNATAKVEENSLIQCAHAEKIIAFVQTYPHVGVKFLTNTILSLVERLRCIS